METPPPTPPATSPPVPPVSSQGYVQPMPYRGSYTPPPRVDAGPPDGAQVIFDTVVGPNVRLKDNLIQLICCVVGAAIGGGIGAVLAPSGDKRIGVFLGIFGGLVVAVFLSGLVIGVVRFFTAVKAKRR